MRGRETPLLEVTSALSSISCGSKQIRPDRKVMGAPSVPYPVISSQKYQFGMADEPAVPLGVRVGFKLKAAVPVRSVHAQEDAKFGISEG